MARQRSAVEHKELHFVPSATRTFDDPRHTRCPHTAHPASRLDPENVLRRQDCGRTAQLIDGAAGIEVSALRRYRQTLADSSQSDLGGANLELLSAARSTVPVACQRPLSVKCRLALDRVLSQRIFVCSKPRSVLLFTTLDAGALSHIDTLLHRAMYLVGRRTPSSGCAPRGMIKPDSPAVPRGTPHDV
jgi:hypothetical protein